MPDKYSFFAKDDPRVKPLLNPRERSVYKVEEHERPACETGSYTPPSLDAVDYKEAVRAVADKRPDLAEPLTPPTTSRLG